MSRPRNYIIQLVTLIALSAAGLLSCGEEDTLRPSLTPGGDSNDDDDNDYDTGWPTDTSNNGGLDTGTGGTVDTGTGGTVDTGTGGTVDTGTGGTIDTGTTPTGDTGPRVGMFDVKQGGYVYAGDWQGYAWTSSGDVAGGTITPADFSQVTGYDDQLCVSGSTAPGYDSVGILGLNINQAAGNNTPSLTWTPSAQNTGIYVNVSNTGGSVLRLQITAGGTDYCVGISNGGNTVLWNQLKTACWGETGTAYNGTTPISQVMLLVPGAESSRVSYNFCLNEIYPVGGTVDTGTIDTDTGPVDTGTGPVDTGTGPVDTGTGGGTPVEGWNVYEGGFVEFGEFHGYAWTAGVGTGTTMSPANFESVLDGANLCVNGSVAAGTGNSALLGINLNQNEGTDTPVNAVVPSSTGISLSVSTNTPALRVQIQTADGNTRWCAKVGSTTTTIPWSSFNTACWDDSGTWYSGQAIAQLMIQVPGSTAAVPYNFCLTGITTNAGGDTDTGSGTVCGSGGGTISGGPFVTTKQFETVTISIGGKSYKVQTNAWGAWENSQQMTIGGTNVFVMDRQDASGTDVKTYPSVYRGKAQGDSTGTASSGMPIQVSSINSLCTGFSTNSTSRSGTFVSTYDVYFTNNQSYSGSSPDLFLMVWLDRNDGFNPIASSYSCTNQAPQGVDSCPDATVTIGGQTYYRFSGNNHEGKKVISYLRANYVDSMSFDLKDFITNAVSANAGLTNSMYLQSVQAGFEIMSGGVGLTVNDFYVLVNGQ